MLTTFRDWLFIVSAALAVLFMLWVLFKFTQELGLPSNARKQAEADSDFVRVVRAGSPEQLRASAQDLH